MKRVLKKNFPSLIILCSIFLCSCGGGNARKSVNEYIKNTQATIPHPVAAKPIPWKTFASKYEASNSRDPFASPSATASGPGAKRYPNSILIQYTLDSLHLVGILNQNNQTWALIKAPDEKIYKITVGSRIGSQQSLVTKIAESNVTLETEQGPHSKKESTLVLEKK